MNDVAYAQRVADFEARRKPRDRELFEVRRIGNHYYVVTWPQGAILTSHRSEIEAQETCAQWVTNHRAA